MTEEQRKIAERELVILNIQDVMELTGWCENVTRDIFAHDKRFPKIKKGKFYQVTLTGLKRYLEEEELKASKNENE